VAVVWIAVVVVGLAVSLAASRGAVGHASALAFGTRVPPFVVGITLVAIGTDLPEIANSIIASAAGHGDLNVGDSVGSAATQVTLVVGLAPFVAVAMSLSRRSVLATGGLTVVALTAVALFVGDGFLGRTDGLMLLGLWILMSLAVWRLADASEPAMTVPARSKVVHALGALVALAAVGAGAGTAVWALVELASLIGVPEYLLAFFATSLGTSLPELVVVATALRQGERDLAIGDAFGSSLLDSTLSVGIGPTLFPVAVSADLGVRGALVAAGAIAIVTAVLWRRGRHDWKSGLLFLALYAALYPLLLI
jgi:cation:H+ antiporter